MAFLSVWIYVVVTSFYTRTAPCRHTSGFSDMVYTMMQYNYLKFYNPALMIILYTSSHFPIYNGSHW